MAISRRDFLKSGFGIASAAALSTTPVLPVIAEAAKSAGKPRLMVAVGESPADNVRKVIDALGGIDKFVKPGDRVFLKPNSITGAGPEFAVNTHPDVVAEVARLCKKAGASTILSLNNDPASSWEENGIRHALESHNGEIGAANTVEMFQTTNLPLGLILRNTQVIREFIEYEVFINLPVAKHHGAAQLTFGMKNYMGLNWDRVIMHRTDLDQAIADLYTVRKPDLVVMDATRMLLNNGPGGPGTVREEKTIVASSDGVAVDAFTATLFKHDPRDIRHIRAAGEMGLGVIDTKKMKIKKFQV